MTWDEFLQAAKDAGVTGDMVIESVDVVEDDTLESLKFTYLEGNRLEVF